ncbi:unnamed protein product [Kluyveromyces dobzhanskii CBS 2104]|uniref:WGS project CCBQ000000000 data, contig 00009 n=1 Tax=Kluyveromyces dobzhanskii CBS 2104 TaxID=1427455 RepID=A0A0A8L592_9SACH|nr:unnamed protein product [Kluyveromyces dobzhanskii CBS 2104]
MNQDSVVPNSEASDEEVVIPLHSDFDAFIAADERQLRVSTENLEPTPRIVPEIELYSNSIRRALRKRKAIQKMPYSLDRLRHRQLLQGFDVSNFDSLADHINLPKNSEQDGVVDTQDYGEPNSSPIRDASQQEETAISSGRLQRHHHFHFSDDADDDDEEYADIALDNNDSEGGSHSDIDSAQVDRSSLSYDDNVLFRGRQVNMRTAYKGVLPKTAWKKALDQRNATEEKQSRIKSNQIGSYPQSKGLAKRKFSHKKVNSKQDDFANDLIQPDEEIEAYSPEPYLHMNHEQDSNADAKLEKYFLQKYEREADSLSPDDDITDITSQGIELLTLDDNDKSALETIVVEPFEKPASTTRNGMFTGVIDFMLAKTEKKSKWLNGRNKLPKTASKGTKLKKRTRSNVGRSRRGKISIMNKGGPSKTPTSKISPSLTTRENTSHGSNKSTSHLYSVQNVSNGDKIEKIKNDRQPKVKNDNKSQQNSKSNRSKMKLFTVAPDSGTELNRKAMTFTTVVEELSDKFAIRSVPQNKRNRPIVNLNFNEDLDIQSTILNHSLLRALAESSTFDSPDVVTLVLNGNKVILSKFSHNAEDSLIAILGNLVKYGGPDYEVSVLAKNLAEFLFSWSSTEAFDIIERFHQEFRAKVNTLRERAKPIHFFFIAVCQFFFLEISRYFSTPIAVRNQISEKVTDHVVSFFRLLSKCDTVCLYSKDNILSEAFSLLSFVVKHLKCNSLLWCKVRQNSFSPAVASVIVSAFETKEPSWSIVKVDQNYQDAVSWIKFICICSNEPYEWEITNDLALDLYAFFKARKFEDFEEELGYQNFPVVSQLEEKPRNTLFNTFISILDSCVFSTSVLEKLTPMSKIHNLSSPSLFTNRLNLLLTLASQSNYNYERRFEELLEQYVLNSDVAINHSIILVMLEGSLSFFKISYEKNVIVRGKWVFLLWKKVSSYKKHAVDKIWLAFWSNLKEIIPYLSKSRETLLKSFQQILHNMLLSDKHLSQISMLLEIYSENLSILDTDWIQTHLLQLLVSKAKVNDTYLRFYCKIAKHLVNKNALTWWSLFHYNTFEHNEGRLITYYTFLAQESDASTFSQMKMTVYQIILTRLLNSSDPSLINLINILARRDPNIQLKIRQTLLNENFIIMKQLLSSLHSAGYLSLFRPFLDELKRVYFSDSSKYDFLKEIVLFLNYNMIDTVRLYPVFIHLRSVFSINDEETENSALREYLRGLSCDSERLLYLIERVLSTLENNMSIPSLIDTLSKATKDKCFDDDIRTFGTVLFEVPLNKLVVPVAPAVIVCVIFLKLLNARVEQSPLKPSENILEYLIHLGYTLSTIVSYYTQQLASNENVPLLFQYYRFFYNLLRTSFGFPQHSEVKYFLRTELSESFSMPKIDLTSGNYMATGSNFEREFVESLSNHDFTNFNLAASISTSELSDQETDYFVMIKSVFF